MHKRSTLSVLTLHTHVFNSASCGEADCGDLCGCFVEFGLSSRCVCKGLLWLGSVMRWPDAEWLGSGLTKRAGELCWMDSGWGRDWLGMWTGMGVLWALHKDFLWLRTGGLILHCGRFSFRWVLDWSTPWLGPGISEVWRRVMPGKSGPLCLPYSWYCRYGRRCPALILF